MNIKLTAQDFKRLMNSVYWSLGAFVNNQELDFQDRREREREKSKRKKIFAEKELSLH